MLNYFLKTILHIRSAVEKEWEGMERNIKNHTKLFHPDLRTRRKTLEARERPTTTTLVT